MILRLHSRQRGVAVVTALLLTTLAITIVGSLFWQQQVQVRSIENQRLQLQKQWILRGALDWTRLILGEDKRIAGRVDHLGEPWAVPLAETRLDQYVDNAQADTEVPDAVLWGGIEDAQARFNLNNLVQNGQVVPEEVEAFSSLLSMLQINPSLAKATATMMVSAAPKTQPEKGAGTGTGTGPATSPAAQNSSTPQPMKITHVDDLLAIPGFTPELLEKLRDFIIVLPTVTKVNVNTASAEVLAARIGKLSRSDAAAIVAMRPNVWFRDMGDFQNRSPAKDLSDYDKSRIDFKTDYFLVNGNVRLNRAGMQMQTLIDRRGSYPVVMWIREN